VDGNVSIDYVKDVAEYADMLLLDTKVGDKVGGTGVTHDYAVDRKIKESTDKRIILSGGLNPENVAAAVKTVRPYAVDVSSGVESKPGVKDPEKVNKFIAVTACL
jgi:phosphoribosylanthranilate isomerase